MEEEFSEASAKATRENRKIEGISVSTGIAHGKVFFINHGDVDVARYHILESDIPIEINRFRDALTKTRQDIQSIKEKVADKVSHKEASIFDAHLMVLEDVALIDETFSVLKEELYNIDYCYQISAKKFVKAFSEMDDPYIRERVSDIIDVSRRVINNMLGRETLRVYNLEEAKIIAGKDIAPSDFALLKRENILGIITEKGSQTSHTAIMARSMKVPCIVGLKDLSKEVLDDAFVLMDGYNGALVLNPSQDEIEKFSEIEASYRQIEQVFNSSLPFPNNLSSGEKFELALNISSPEEITEIPSTQFDSVGLFRTENYFLDTGTFPTEEEQFHVYKHAAINAQNKEVVIRTLDIGGDKNFTTLQLCQKEENPFMGYRAIRFCLDHEDIFLNQLRAILRASTFGNISLMVPMISSPSELRKAKAIFEKAKEQLREKEQNFNENIKFGIMIEVPSAAITADILGAMCDFISIGTNDLIQYMFAVDRVNDKVAYLYDPSSPAIIRVLGTIIARAKSTNPDIKISVCGEMASDPIFAPLLIGMGIDCLSMSNNSMAHVKFLLRKLKKADLDNLIAEVAKHDTARAITKTLRDFYYESTKDYLGLNL